MSDFQQLRVEAPAGVNFAREQAQLDPQIWDNAENVTFRHGITKKCSGYEEGFGPAYTTPEVIIPLRDGSQQYYWWVYAGKKTIPDSLGAYKKQEERLYRITAKDVHEDVTPTTGVTPDTLFYDDIKWTGDTINGVPYLCKSKPYLWDVSSAKFRPMRGFPEHVSFKVMRTYRNFMIGLNIATKDFAGSNIGDEEKPWCGFGPWSTGVHQNALWWSHDVVGSDLDTSADEWDNQTNVGFSMWRDADPTKNSGWNFLGGSGGPIVDGRSMRDSFIIYRERSVWQMTYIGGINVFSFKELFNDAGALTEHCIADVEGQHFVVGQSDVYIHNGVQKQSVADGVVRRELFKSIDPAYIDNVFVTASYKDKELWVCIPEATTNIEGSCNVAYVFNWEEKHWSRRDIPDLTCGTYTILSIPETDPSWEAPGEQNSWEELAQEESWLASYSKYSASNWGTAYGSKREILPDSSNYNIWKDPKGWFNTSSLVEGKEITESQYFVYTSQSFEPKFNGKDFESFVEKRWLDMGDRSDATFVNKIYPLVRGGFVDVYMAGTSVIQDNPVWKFQGTFDGSKDTKLSTRVSGNFIHIKFVIPKLSQAEIRGYWLEWSKIGRRA